MLKNKVIFFVSVSVLLACKPGKPELPVIPPNDFKLNYHLDGGMADYSVDISVKPDSCHYRKRQEGKITEKSLKLAVKEFHTLYDLVKKSEFDKMESVADKGIVYDRGGESITVSWNKNTVTVSNAQNNFVKEKWFEKWKTLCEGLDNFATGKIAAK